VLLLPNFQRSFGLFLTTHFLFGSAKVSAFIYPTKSFLKRVDFFVSNIFFEKNYIFFSKADGKDMM
jgi:hypothetical protein